MILLNSFFSSGLIPSLVISSAKPLIAFSGVRTSWHIFLIKAFFIRSLSCAFSLAIMTSRFDSCNSLYSDLIFPRRKNMKIPKQIERMSNARNRYNWLRLFCRSISSAFFSTTSSSTCFLISRSSTFFSMLRVRAESKSTVYSL